MKKQWTLLLLASLCIMQATAQTDTLFYYYQGKKMPLQQTYSLIVVGLKNQGQPKATTARAFGVTADSVQLLAGGKEAFVHTGGRVSKTSVEKTIAGLDKKVVAYARPALAGLSGKKVTYGEDFIVALKPGATIMQLQGLLARYNCLLKSKYPFAPGIYLLAAGEANGYDALKMANLFYESGLFEYAEPDFRTHKPFSEAPNDPLYRFQWPHKNNCIEQWECVKDADMNIDSAWLVTTGSSDIKVAVLDTGVDTGHADLKPNLLQGFDCTTLTSNPGDGRPRDIVGAHGTACAGIIGAIANNGIGVAGIAPNCKIIPINMTDENANFASDFSIAAGLDYAWQNDAAVISNSWTLGMLSGAVNGAIDRAAKQGRGGKGTVLLFATGNNNSGIDYPSSNPQVIAVGGVNMCEQRKSFYSCDGQYNWGANYGAGLDVVAPCVLIPTTDISGEGGYNKSSGTDGDYYEVFGGTSSACPNAAGVMALILSANPALTMAQARVVMETSCDKIPNYPFAMTPGYSAGPWNEELGYGRINAYKAVQAAQSGLYCTVEAEAAGSTILCKNGTVELRVLNPSAATYQWRFNGTPNDSGRNRLVASNAGIYDVLATYANGCTATSIPFTVSIPQADSLVADAGKPVTICTGGEPVRLGGMPSARGGVKLAGNRRGYGVDLLRSGGILKFDIENPRSYSLGDVTPPSISDRAFYTGDFTPLGYYLLSRTGNLVRMDTVTGQQTFIGKLTPRPGIPANSISWTGLAWNETEQQLYAVTSGGPANHLYKVDLLTGLTTTGTVVRDNAISWIAFNSNGTLFGFSASSTKITRLDKNTGYFYGISSEAVYGTPVYWLDGGFDPLTGKLYLTTYYFSNQTLGEDLRVMDTLTGKITVKGVVGYLSQVGGTAISGGNYDYTWSPASFLSSSKDANPLAKPLQPTTYTLTVKDHCGNVAVSSVTVTPNAGKPAIKISGPKDSICVGETVRLSATQNDNYYYQWMVNGKIIPGAKDSFYVAARMGRYQVKVTAGRGGCENTSTVFNVRDCSIRLNNNNNDTTCYSYFYASGGYADTSFRQNERWVKTIYPAEPGNKLKINFSDFQIRAYYGSGFDTNDTLFVYGGAGINAVPIGVFSAAYGPILNYDYYSVDGPLTFKFRSGPHPDNVGSWDAFISCFKPRVFRSRITGKFNRPNTWEVKGDDGRFTRAQTIPQYFEDSIIIQTGHTVTLDTPALKLDQLWVQSGAKLVVTTYFTLINGAGYDLVADGDIEMTSYGSITGAGTLLLRGGLTCGYNTIQTPLYVNGTVPQTINCQGKCMFDSVYFQNGNGVTVNGSAVTNFLVMDAPGTVQVDSAFFVNWYLYLKNGIIQVKGNHEIRCWRDITLEGGNNKSFIDGYLQYELRETPGTYNPRFPSGYGTSTFKPVTLHIQRRRYVYDQLFKARYIGQAPPPYNLPAGISKIINTGYWHIQPSKTDTVSTAAITLAYTAEDEVMHDTTNLRIVKHDGNGNWVDIGGLPSNVDTGTITSTIAFSTWGEFALAWASGTLPVKWLSFTASLKGKEVELVWIVANEVNCDYYGIEHSTDGITFSELATLPAQSGLALNKTYRWPHVNPANGNHYYRIKQVDKDGRFSHSKTEQVGISNGAWYSVTPNPAGNHVLITAGELIREIYCYDLQGRLVKTARPKALQHRLALSGLPAAVYNLKIVTEGGVYHKKLVKAL
ncbi:S8 family serine peptidase [Foetidibacter luteolus]|uniref:S8 family serine peptidase n=1 Tax=Foetidibacter luteolus TaxID=2608880 RepID=UPI00129AE409|nr:S8 family serine peptidase [Foetidibacter luteolus]